MGEYGTWYDCGRRVFLKKWNNQMVAHSPQSVLPISNNGGPWARMNLSPQCAPEEIQRGRQAYRSNNTNVNNKSPLSTLWRIVIIRGVLMFCVFPSLPTVSDNEKISVLLCWFSIHTKADFVPLSPTVTQHQRLSENACPELRAEYQDLTGMCS